MNTSRKMKHVLLSILLCFGCSQTLRAETLSCTVGDLTEGYWQRYSIGVTECLASGPPAPDSPWPSAEDWGLRAYHIQGRIKLSAGIGGSGWKPTVPQSGEGYGCITGFADASAAAFAEKANNDCQVNPYCQNVVYSSSGNLITQTHYAVNGSTSSSYNRFWDVAFRLYEWQCYNDEPVEYKNNFGEICPN